MTVQKFPFYNVTTKTKPFGLVFLYLADAQTVLRSNAQPVFILKKTAARGQPLLICYCFNYDLPAVQSSSETS